MVNETTKLWEETDLDPKDSSYVIEKTMRFEIAQKSVSDVFSSFRSLVEDYKSLCEELEKNDEP